MRILALSAAAAALALPAAASAQDAGEAYDYEPYGDYGDYDGDQPEPLPETGYEEPLSSRLSDPVVQDQLASTVAVLGEILLDLPLAPIVEPMAQAAGRGPGSVDPDLTLRKMNPGAGEMPARAARELPRAMGAMSAMAGSIEAMRPALRDMADRLRFEIDEARRGAY